MSDELRNLIKTVRGTAQRKGIDVPERATAQQLSAILGGPNNPLADACAYLNGWIARNYDFERGKEMLMRHINHARACARLDQQNTPPKDATRLRRLDIEAQERAFAIAINGGWR